MRSKRFRVHTHIAPPQSAFESDVFCNFRGRSSGRLSSGVKLFCVNEEFKLEHLPCRSTIASRSPRLGKFARFRSAVCDTRSAVPSKTIPILPLSDLRSSLVSPVSTIHRAENRYAPTSFHFDIM